MGWWAQEVGNLSYAHLIVWGLNGYRGSSDDITRQVVPEGGKAVNGYSQFSTIAPR